MTTSRPLNHGDVSKLTFGLRLKVIDHHHRLAGKSLPFKGWDYKNYESYIMLGDDKSTYWFEPEQVAFAEPEPPDTFPEALIREAVRMALELRCSYLDTRKYTEDEIVNKLKKEIVKVDYNKSELPPSLNNSPIWNKFSKWSQESKDENQKSGHTEDKIINELKKK